MSEPVQYSISGQSVHIEHKLAPPVLLFCYNRPKNVRLILDALALQTVLPPKIIAFVDGPATYDDEKRVADCLSLLREYTVIPLEVVEHTDNFGRKASILSGLKEALEQYEAVVVLEDDLLPGADYYQVMSDLLNYYAPAQQIFSIFPIQRHTYSNETLSQLPTDAFVTNRFSHKGFATWANRWTNKQFEHLYYPNYNPFGHVYNIPWERNILDIITTHFKSHLLGETEHWWISTLLECVQNNSFHIGLKLPLVKDISHASPMSSHTLSKTPVVQNTIKLPKTPLLPPAVLTAQLNPSEKIKFMIQFASENGSNYFHKFKKAFIR